MPTDAFHGIIASAPWPLFPNSSAGKAILPSNPNLTDRRLIIGALSHGGAGLGTFSNVRLFEWSGTATGIPKIYDGFGVELFGTVSGGNRIYTNGWGATIVFNPSSGITVTQS